MLDDDKYVHNLDKGNALGIIAGQLGQLQQQFDFELPAFGGINNLVVAGMGGSALDAEFIRSWTSDKLKLPITIVRDYQLPAFVGPASLVVVSSYSGNTEETLACLEDALNKHANVVVISAGGELQERAEASKLPYINLPSGYQPRMAVLFGVKALSVLFEKLGLASGLSAELEAAAESVRPAIAEWTAETPSDKNQAKQIATELLGAAVVVYGGPTLAFAATKWKIDINENSKNAAFYYHLPEFSHNEFQGWLFPPSKQFKVVELQSDLDVPHINKRFEVSNRLLSGKMPTPIIVKAVGKTKLEQLLWAIILGDFVSAYLAFLNGIDPTPVDLVEKLKKELQ